MKDLGRDSEPYNYSKATENSQAKRHLTLPVLSAIIVEELPQLKADEGSSVAVAQLLVDVQQIKGFI